MIEADRERRGRGWRRKQEGERKEMRGNSCNWRMARPSLGLQRMGIFNRTEVHFGGFRICHHVHLFTSPPVHHTSHIRKLGATTLPDRLSPPLPTLNLPFSPQKIGTRTHVIDRLLNYRNPRSHPDCRPASAPVSPGTSAVAAAAALSGAE